MSSCVPLHTAAVVVVECVVESSTVILILTSPITGMLVLLAAANVKLDGDSCSSVPPIAVHTDLLITQRDAPVSARALTDTA